MQISNAKVSPPAPKTLTVTVELSEQELAYINQYRQDSSVLMDLGMAIVKEAHDEGLNINYGYAPYCHRTLWGNCNE